MKEWVKKNKRLVSVVIFVILVCLISLVRIRGEYLDILSIGENYISSFWENVKYEGAIFGISFLVLFALFYFNTKLIHRGLKKFFEAEKRNIPKLPNKSLSFIISFIISAITMFTMKEKVMLGLNATQFGMTDSAFNMDIGFYVFVEPLIELILYYVIGVMIVLLIYTIIYYIVIFNRMFNTVDIEILKQNIGIKQIITYVIVISLAIAGLTFLHGNTVVLEESINIGNNISLYGGSFMDVTVEVWGYRILALIIPVSFFIGLMSLKHGKIKKSLLCFFSIPTYLVLLVIIMFLYEIIMVKPNELDNEKEYIQSNIDATKQAYNIEIDEIELENSGTITSDEVNKYSSLINNIPIINSNIVLENLKEYQTNTGYYSFNNINVAKYNVQGKDTICYIAPREINTNNSKSYNSNTYEYTHGYGAIVVSASEVDEDGNIEYIQKGIDENAAISITESRIYFGLETNQTIITNVNNTVEFDYPITSSTNEENVYDGKAGIKLNWLDRLMLGIYTGNIRIAFNTNMNENSKIITNRNILDRVKKIMPYLIYDDNPYMVITDEGKLVWIIDAYTVSNCYPYSQMSEIEVNGNKVNINYIRNSVKVLVDAYNGTVDFYIVDGTDPIIMAYRNIFPDLFIYKSEEIPSDISRHMLYPQLLYNVQANMLNIYHNVQTDVLYRNDDEWELAKAITNKNSTVNTVIQEISYYTYVNTIDSEKNELGLVTAYTKSGKQNIIAYLIGIYDGTNTLKLYKFNSDDRILGLVQLDNQIEQDENIAQELKSINVTGAKMVKQTMVVPIDNTVLYVESIYQILLNESQIPVLKKVIVASGNKIAIGDNLQEAIECLISQEAIKIEIDSAEVENDIISEIIKANKNLSESSASNDWELMGKDIKKLQNLIEQLEKEQLQKKNEEKEVINITQNTLANILNENFNNIVE